MNPVYFEYGEIWDGYSNTVIESPSIVIDQISGIVHKYGSKIFVTKYFEKVSRNKLLSENLLLIEFDTGMLTGEQICYILLRCINFSAGKFQIDLCRMIQEADCAQFISWLNTEMAHVPLSLESV